MAPLVPAVTFSGVRRVVCIQRVAPCQPYTQTNMGRRTESPQQIGFPMTFWHKALRVWSFPFAFKFRNLLEVSSGYCCGVLDAKKP
jgi:hypothetical protein